MPPRRAPGTGVVAGTGALNLDHLCAQVGEVLRGPRAGKYPGKVEDADMRKRSRHGDSSFKMERRLYRLRNPDRALP
jgi:hypothetical protein